MADVHDDLSLDTSSAEDLAKLLLVSEGGMESQVAQIAHRQKIITACGGISSGSKVLELGCGQGDCTVVLAAAASKEGSVDAVDPAPPGYGSPYTVEETHKHISTTRIGPRINWIDNADPLAFLPENSDKPIYNIGVLCHSLWYFSSPAIITETLRRLSSLCEQIFIAEWSLTASTPYGYPHVLAALTQASLECRKPETESNVRTVVSPDAIIKLAEDAGLKLFRESFLTPAEDVYDGRWEVSAVAHSSFVKEIEENMKDERERAVVLALRDATLRSLKGINGGAKSVRSMEVWCGAFKPSEALGRND